MDVSPNSNQDVNSLNNNGKTKLSIAAELGQHDTIKLLLQKGADPNVSDSDGRTPLIVAVHSRKPNIMDLVHLLIQYGSNLDFPGPKGQTVLHYACEKGYLQLAKYLIHKGCALDPQDYRRFTPLLKASYAGHTHVVQYLVESGANVEYSSRGGFTVLHRSCGRGWLGVVKALIKKQINLNEKDSDTGDTALHIALTNKHMEIVKRLLKAGADCTIRNNIGDSAFFEFTKNPSVCSVEHAAVFIEHGAYFQATDDYMRFLTPIFKDVNFCTNCIINGYNNMDLPKLYEIHEVSDKLPPIQKIKISFNSNVAQNIAQSVSSDICNNTYCNVLKVRPTMLQSLCVKSLVNHYTEF